LNTKISVGTNRTIDEPISINVYLSKEESEKKHRMFIYIPKQNESVRVELFDVRYIITETPTIISNVVCPVNRYGAILR